MQLGGVGGWGVGKGRGEKGVEVDSREQIVPLYNIFRDPEIRKV